MSAANRNNMTSAAHNNGFLVDASENELVVGEWRELGDMVALFEENHFNYPKGTTLDYSCRKGEHQTSLCQTMCSHKRLEHHHSDKG